MMLKVMLKMGTMKIAVSILQLLVGCIAVYGSTCPTKVGGPVSAAKASTSANDAYLIVNATFPCNATVTSWVYTRTQEAAVIYASVWRTMVSGPENYFLLIGRNRIPPGKPGKRVFTVDPRFRIVVKKGDFLGFHYSVKSDAGALASWSKDDANVTIDDVTMHQTITAGLYDENFLLNVPINFNTNDRKVRMMYHALSAVVQPDATPEQPRTADVAPSSISLHPLYPTLPTLPLLPVSQVTSPPKGKSLNRVFCYNVTAEIKCDRSLIKIEKARYGHTQMPCKRDWQVKKNEKVFQPDCVMNVWPLVHGRCSNKIRCRFHISEDVFGRPCSGSRGTGLNVIYRCIQAKDPLELLSPYSNDSPIVVNISEPQVARKTSKAMPLTTWPQVTEKQTVIVITKPEGTTTSAQNSLPTESSPIFITTKEVREPLVQEPAVNGGLIAGVVCGLVILICLFVAVILIHRKRNRRKKTIPRLVQSFLLTERLQPNPLYDSRSNVNTPRDGQSPAHEASSKIINASEIGTTEHRGKLHVGWLPQCSDHAVYESVNTSPSKSEGSASLQDRTYYNLIGRILVPDTRGRSRSVTGVADTPPDVDTSTYQAGSCPL